MKNLEYQQRAVTELIDKTIRLLNAGGQRNKMVFEATTGAGKTVMACLMLAGLMDELHDRGDSRYQEVAFIWFAPRKLHIQSYEKLKEAFEETRTLRPVMFDELDQNEGIRPGEILFVNWESVNKESNVMVREGDCSLSLYEITDKTKDEFGLPIVAIIDEEHMFWSKTADKSSAVLDRINPAVEIRISATPKTANPKEKVTVYRQDVIAAEMIKKEVVLNPEIELNFSDELELNANLIKAALDKRNQIAEAYKAVGTRINSLLLIQLPNDTKENMTAEDTAIADQVKKYLEVMCGITTDNHRLAIWLATKRKSDRFGETRQSDRGSCFSKKPSLWVGTALALPFCLYSVSCKATSSLYRPLAVSCVCLNRSIIPKRCLMWDMCLLTLPKTRYK
ncbi:MAG: DEAD/DEAH box helicase family protein [Bacteroides sp.]